MIILANWVWKPIFPVVFALLGDPGTPKCENWVRTIVMQASIANYETGELAFTRMTQYACPIWSGYGTKDKT